MAHAVWAAAAANASLGALARLLRHGKLGRAALARCSVVRDVAYVPGASSADHRLDIWRPRARTHAGALPLVVYVHGGGFALCDKETHYLVGAALAARGLCVANVNYRRVPRHVFPASLHDVARAIAFCVQQAPSLGAHGGALSLMGESAGANLVLAQALALARGEADAPGWASPLWASGARLEALLPAAGLLDVEEPARFDAAAPAPSALVRSRIRAVCAGYAPALPADADPAARAAHAWASPLRLLEAAATPLTNFPPTWVGVGGSDPILGDSERLARVLAARRVPCTLRRYPGRGHAFFALPRGTQDESFWGEAAGFVAAHHGGGR